MRETITRTISGFVYIAILVSCIFFREESFLLLFLIFATICLFELQKMLKLKNVFPFFLLILLFYFFSYTKWNHSATLLLLAATLLVNLYMIRDLLVERKITLLEKNEYVIVIFYLISSFIFLTLIPSYTLDYNPLIVIGAFVLIWANDTFAYIVGKNFGRKKLYEKISPNKTVEGFWGGLLFTVIASYGVYYFTDQLTFPIWMGMALIIGIFGTFGDLIQSKLKRQAGVKDSGKLMPGHGGLFDRLDSIVFASPFIYAYLQITLYVS
ncbi:MAG TPA: phosphatidate cytidylyltransferase [Salinimicrobium sp.]|nr:phosphatidate cytidylyltransferase [Salinimicrobium sp.]